MLSYALKAALELFDNTAVDYENTASSMISFFGRKLIQVVADEECKL